MTPALLVLRDGRVFRGEALGAEGEATGEVIFNTAMQGYQEILTDPSYRGQIVTMTYPMIGNYGVNAEDVESRRPWVNGFVVREASAVPSSWRGRVSLHDYLRAHGIVGNGWYFRDECEVKFWRQSNRLVHGPKVWDVAKQRDADFTCANLFWWYAMYSSADYTVTPRPMYPADGRKLPDVWTEPAELRDELQSSLGQFPLFKFWGPATGIAASRWIADCARHVYETKRPTLTLVYLPHLDYNLQRLGPGHPAIAGDLRAVDALCGELIAAARRDGTRVVALSEYGITPVRSAPVST